MTTETIKDYTRRITSASATDIVVIMYELADKYLEDAVKADNHEEYLKQCVNAKRVVDDLIGALDFDYGLAMPLYRIYEYINKEISAAIIKNDPDKLSNCRRFLSSLKGSFEKIASDDTSGPAMENTQSVYVGLTYGKGVLNESVAAQKDNRGYTV